jgi:glutaredoxin-related protein
MKFKFLFLIFLFIVKNTNAQTNTIILGRPTDKSVTASILFDQNVDFYLEYGLKTSNYAQKTNNFANVANTPDEIDMTGLLPNTKYFYRLRYKLKTATTFLASAEYSFQTQRAKGETFSFTVEADEHLYDKKGIRSLYEICLANQLSDKPDFMLSLGDTFGDDHTPTTTTSNDMRDLHKDYLQHLGKICHSVPFFFCLGNHEGENGYYLKQNPPNNIATYGTIWRKFYYPNPIPNDFYSGNMVSEGNNIGLPENYYAFEWGDALFVVLDVYRHCDVNEKPKNWEWTLGKTQYDWLKTTLENSKSKQKFVFAHHNLGQGRGGIVPAKGFEWGGIDGNQNKFAANRPGWAMPIHQLMVKNGVKIFFQGHDHLFAKEQLDGLVYQETPMPSDTTYEIGMLANADAYTDVTLNGSGHLRVTVSANCVKVDFVRAYLPKDETATKKNQEVAYSYTVGTCATATNELEKEDFVKIFPNPANDKLYIEMTDGSDNFDATLYNTFGQIMLKSNSNNLNISSLENGIYFLQIEKEGKRVVKKVMVSR